MTLAIPFLDSLIRDASLGVLWPFAALCRVVVLTCLGRRGVSYELLCAVCARDGVGLSLGQPW